ncbi:hypothetical protein SAMN05428961_101579 [Paenibacillus sp. OK060]|nr:hypothetical protein SAMN05428961_101579 [Paenibacillus sp. OK060]
MRVPRFNPRGEFQINLFKQKYKLNPVEALTFYFLENVDWYTYRQWIEAGGTAELCIRLRSIKARP